MVGQSILDSTSWLKEILEEVKLEQFHHKLTNDLQLTKLAHFDFVSEEDLIQLGISRPASRRLLAAIKKRKSFVTSIKNKILNKLIPSSITASSSNSAIQNKPNHSIFNSNYNHDKHAVSKRLTCLINSLDVQIKEEIGHGAHGFVKKGEWTTPGGRVVEVALKILRKDVTSDPSSSFEDFVKEIGVMHQLNHPNIIKLYGVVLSSPMMMVTELAPFGNLRDRLRLESGHTPISQLINFGVQIASGMSYLESRRFVHRDLAARNIFVTYGKKILIGDLGLMRIIPDQVDHYVMNERTRIPYPWCAPESLRFKRFSSSSDVYMFGVTLWEMFSFGKEPWVGLNYAEILENICSQKKRLPCPEACLTIVYQTLLKCWDIEPSCRPNFSTLYQYLSTSYPLEVRATQHISDITCKHVKSQQSALDTKVNQATYDENRTSLSNRRILNCSIEDKIFVIDGQPEKYWWKGQNQRTFEIGWFPLCSTRWLTPKKGSQFVSKPLKDSFIDSANFGLDGHWDSGKYQERLALRIPSKLDNISAPNNLAKHKSKSKSKFSRFFGINEFNNLSATSNLLPHSYQRLDNELKSAHRNSIDSTPEFVFPNVFQNENQPTRSEDSCPLIDFSDNPNTITDSTVPVTVKPNHQPSLIDMDNAIPLETTHRHASDSQLEQIYNSANYPPSRTGSWNTGTFYDSNTNIYSAYYCPRQDAANTLNRLQNPDTETGNRYYSPVASQDEAHKI